MRQVVETMRAAGQMVVASAGNDGIFGCSSVQAPIAMHDAVFSVGAHDSTGTIAGFSSRGPVTADGSGRLKPDISAPGVNVISANLGGGTVPLSGTSMASPHVAGAVALLWSAVPALIGDIDRTEQILIKSATPVPANNCGEGGTPVVPNNTFGFGRLNIQAAIAMAQAPVGLTVAVTESNGQPVSDWEVTVVDTLTSYRYTSVTVFNGVALFPDLYAGAYQVETAMSTPAQNVVLSAGQPNHLSLQLAAPPPTIELYFPQVLN
ncbi:MAG TPA: S8 family serine peptidase [Caldilineaceae bacterium]|nr:S8 family serine peptidase [Caldilineaceae bacterium]